MKINNKNFKLKILLIILNKLLIGMKNYKWFNNNILI